MCVKKRERERESVHVYDRHFVYYSRVLFLRQYLQRGGSRLAEQQRRLKSQIWSSVVTIVLVEGKNMLPMDADGTSDPYVKFR